MKGNLDLQESHIILHHSALHLETLGQIEFCLVELSAGVGLQEAGIRRLSPLQ